MELGLGVNINLHRPLRTLSPLLSEHLPLHYYADVANSVLSTVVRRVRLQHHLASAPLSTAPVPMKARAITTTMERTQFGRSGPSWERISQCFPFGRPVATLIDDQGRFSRFYSHVDSWQGQSINAKLLYSFAAKHTRRALVDQFDFNVLAFAFISLSKQYASYLRLRKSSLPHHWTDEIFQLVSGFERSEPLLSSLICHFSSWRRGGVLLSSVVR